jgi:hypothetical protein
LRDAPAANSSRKRASSPRATATMTPRTWDGALAGQVQHRQAVNRCCAAPCHRSIRMCLATTCNVQRALSGTGSGIQQRRGLSVAWNHDLKLKRKLDGRNARITHGLTETLKERSSRVSERESWRRTSRRGRGARPVGRCLCCSARCGDSRASPAPTPCPNADSRANRARSSRDRWPHRVLQATSSVAWSVRCLGCPAARSIGHVTAPDDGSAFVGRGDTDVASLPGANQKRGTVN